MFRGRQVVAQGLLTRRQLDSRAWRPVLRGVYADAQVEVTHGLYVAAARLLIPKPAAIAGRSAAWIYGADDVIAVDEPVEVVVPAAHRFGPIAGIRVRTVTALPAAATREWAGTRVTTPARTAADIARFAPDLVEAVVLLDMLVAAGALRPAHVEDCRASLGSLPGSRRTRRALALADGRSESPQESRLRVRLVLAGLPPPTPQYEVRHRGRFVARVDLAYPERKLAIEYDGAWHGAAGQLGRDRRRLNALVAAGWRVIHVTAADLHSLDQVIATIRTALAA